MADPSSRPAQAVVEAHGTYFRAWEAAPAVALTLSIGKATMAGARACIDVLEQTLRRSGTLFVATDASRLVGYDPDVRELYTSWYGAHRAVVNGMHILMSSGMVKMAVALTNNAVGGYMVQHTDREVFERAVLAHAPGLDLTPFRTLPTTPMATPRARIAP